MHGRAEIQERKTSQPWPAPVSGLSRCCKAEVAPRHQDTEGALAASHLHGTASCIPSHTVCRLKGVSWSLGCLCFWSFLGTCCLVQLCSNTSLSWVTAVPALDPGALQLEDWAAHPEAIRA